MKNKNKIEDLLINLPDYINGKIKDTDLMRKIENRIKTNADFRDEYEKIKNSFSFLKETKLEEPPAHYFSTLLPKINERLEATQKHEGISIWEKIFSYWKFAIPVVPIILVFIILKIDFFNPDETLKKDVQNEIIIKEKIDNNIDTKENKDLAVIQEDTNIESDKTLIKNVKSKSSYEYDYQNNTDNNSYLNSDNGSYISEYLEEVEDYYYDDEYLFEEDYEELSTEEQNEIISKLKEEDF